MRNIGPMHHPVAWCLFAAWVFGVGAGGQSMAEEVVGAKDVTALIRSSLLPPEEMEGREWDDYVANLEVESVLLRVLPRSLPSPSTDVRKLIRGKISRKTRLTGDVEWDRLVLEQMAHEAVIYFRESQYIVIPKGQEREAIISQIDDVLAHVRRQLSPSLADDAMRVLHGIMATHRTVLLTRIDDPLRYSLKRSMSAEELTKTKAALDSLLRMEGPVAARFAAMADGKAEFRGHVDTVFRKAAKAIRKNTIRPESLKTGEELSPGYTAVVRQMNAMESTRSQRVRAQEKAERRHKALLHRMSVDDPEKTVDEHLASQLGAVFALDPLATAPTTAPTTAPATPTPAKLSAQPAPATDTADTAGLGPAGYAGIAAAIIAAGLAGMWLRKRKTAGG